MTVYDDEIDLRPYILALTKRWWQIALIAVLAAAVACAYSFFLTSRTYEATAKVLITRSRATLSLAEQFPTVTEPVDPNSRMNAMLSIAQGDALALDTLKSIESQLPSNARDLGTIKGLVTVTNNGDIFLITAKAGDPNLAATIANAWARQAVEAINLAYSGDQPLVEIQAQVKTSQQAYDQAQTALENFIKNNQIDIIGKKINEAKALFSGLADERARNITYYSDRIQQLDQLVIQAEALKDQLQGGSRSAAGSLGDALAVLQARAGALGINSNLASSDPSASNTASGLTLNLQISNLQDLNGSSANHAADLESLISLAKSEQTRMQAALDSFTQQVEQSAGYDQIDPIAAQIRTLQAQQEQQQAQQRELTSQRDTAWQAYQALSQKAVEIQNAAQTTNQVSLASLAIPPENPTARGTLRNSLVAGVLGLMLGVIWVIGAQWWREFNRGEAVAPVVTTTTQLGERPLD
jgi:capsular polysaccharide biosynthesis protein